MNEASTLAAADARGSHRSNVFLTAVLHVAGCSLPVRIRNLSPAGALLDGRVVPNAGDAVRLQRGPYTAAARVVWRRLDACGVRFASDVPVHEWIDYAPGHPSQQQVDEMIATVRAGAPAADVDGAGEDPAPADPMRTVEQLGMVSDRLEQIAEELAAIPAVVEQGSAALQNLDIARQRLVGLASQMRLAAR